ncbi:hypothetical protein [Nitrosomonas sp.]|uniref:hypothetical protein n=1 Tax=Nitrosomonas sp. TaxID=42353 RepID=UPI001D30973C|nr:hypothetical protein [Nitrosomonas sp.]MBX3617404.1 hypothetical protein [Nitrosomonas sp.]
MKAGSEASWVAKLGGAVLVSLFALPVHAQLMLAHEGHHDAGGCTIKTGEFPVTFSAYEVPEGNIPPMHSYCENLPSPGKVNLTIELPRDQRARDTPLAVRVVLEGHGGHGGHGGKHTAAEQKAPEKEMDHSDHEGMDHGSHVGDKHADPTHGAMEHDNYYLPPMAHKSGIIVIATNLTERGRYNILLEEDDGAGNMKTVVSIPLNVGMGGGHAGHGGGLGMMEILVLLIVVGGGAGYYFYSRKKASETAA